MRSSVRGRLLGVVGAADDRSIVGNAREVGSEGKGKGSEVETGAR